MKNMTTEMMRKRSRTDEDDNIGGDDKRIDYCIDEETITTE